MKRALYLLAAIPLLGGCIALGPTFPMQPAGPKAVGTVDVNIQTQDQSANPNLAEIYVDGDFYGNPVDGQTAVRLKEGEHTVRVILKGHETYERDIRVVSSQVPQTINVFLERPAPAPAKAKPEPKDKPEPKAKADPKAKAK